jgi:hypothetical protein
MWLWDFTVWWCAQTCRLYFGFCIKHILYIKSYSDLAILSVQATLGYGPNTLSSITIGLTAADETEISAPAKGSNSISFLIQPITYSLNLCQTKHSAKNCIPYSLLQNKALSFTKYWDEANLWETQQFDRLKKGKMCIIILICYIKHHYLYPTTEEILVHMNDTVTSLVYDTVSSVEYQHFWENYCLPWKSKQ